MVAREPAAARLPRFPLDPIPAAGDLRAREASPKYAHRLGLGDDERQLHHAAVDRDRLALVADVAELLERVGDGLGVVLQQAPDVPEPEPEVGGDAVGQVVGRGGQDTELYAG